METADQSMDDLEAKLAKVEQRLNELLEQAQNTPTPEPEQTQTSQQPESNVQSTSTQVYGKSKKQIIEEYEKDYLERLENKRIEQEELVRATKELQTKKKAEQSSSHTGSTRGLLPKGF